MVLAVALVHPTRQETEGQVNQGTESDRQIHQDEADIEALRDLGSHSSDRLVCKTCVENQAHVE